MRLAVSRRRAYTNISDAIGADRGVVNHSRVIASININLLMGMLEQICIPIIYNS